MLTKKEEKLLRLAESGGKDSDLVILDEIDALDEKVSKLETKFDKVVEEVKSTAPDLDKVLESVKGNDGKDSEVPGPKGDKGDKGDAGKDGRNGLDGKYGKNGKDGKDGKDGKNGLNGLDGKDGKNGKDGDIKDLSPDEIRNSLELLQGNERLDASAIKNLPKAGTGGVFGGHVIAGQNIKVNGQVVGLNIPIQSAAPDNPQPNDLWISI